MCDRDQGILVSSTFSFSALDCPLVQAAFVVVVLVRLYICVTVYNRLLEYNYYLCFSWFCKCCWQSSIYALELLYKYVQLIIII
jgi:hypothetical protein